MRISDFGIQVDVPAGWYARLFQIVEPEVSPPTLHVSSRPLAERDDRMSNYATLTARAMGPNDATLALLSWSREPRQVFDGLKIERLSSNAPLQIGAEHFLPVQGVPGTQVAAYRLFTKNGRYFSLRVVFGSNNPSAGLIQTVNRILSSIVIGPSRDKQAGGDGDLVVFVPPPGLDDAPPATGASVEVGPPAGGGG
jgi:hypothetical protein